LAAQHAELFDLLLKGENQRCKARLIGHLNDAENALLVHFNTPEIV
jgi:DNA-binding GntR family transcriptional regulator